MRCLTCGRDGLAIAELTCPGCGVHVPSSLRDTLPRGTRLHHYRVDYALGKGGFGITYRAVHTGLEQVVAIKELFPQAHGAHRDAGTGRVTVPDRSREAFARERARFAREGKILASLPKHRSVVHVQDLFEMHDTVYLVMEHLTGRTLRDELASRGGKLAPERVVAVIEALVSALELVHGMGVCHLDIKPDNVMVCTDGRIVLVDFGAARHSAGTGTTRAYTADYAPVEVVAGKAVGPGSDLFELAMMMHELLLGELPPRSAGRAVADDWRPRAELGRWCEPLRAALAVKLADRPPSVRMWWEAAHASAPILPRPPGRRPAVRPHRLRLASAGAGVLLLGGVYWLGASSRADDREPEPEITRQPRERPSKPELTATGTVAVPPRLDPPPPPAPVPLPLPPPVPVPQSMVHIAGGTFLMGSDERDDEKPPHAVAVTSFELDETEVTVRAYRRCVQEGVCSVPAEGNYREAGRDDHPVNFVRWQDAVSYCAWLGKRLPTEEEWEYAARGAEGRTFPWGEQEPSNQLCWDGDAASPTCQVASYPRDRAGLYDMAGNVWEWTATWYCGYQATDCEQRFRAIRGGGRLGRNRWGVRGAGRGFYSPVVPYHNLGFRCAR